MTQLHFFLKRFKKVLIYLHRRSSILLQSALGCVATAATTYYRVTAMERHARKIVFQNIPNAGYHENMIGRTYVGGDQVTQLN